MNVEKGHIIDHVRTLLTGVILPCAVLALSLTSCKTTEETHSAVPPKVTNTREQFKNFFHEAMTQKMLGHFDLAIANFEQCLVLEPNNAAVHFALSELYRDAGNVFKAIDHGNKAHAADQTNKWYVVNLAQLHYTTGAYSNSLPYFDLAIDENETDSVLLYQYLDALTLSGENEKAIALIDQIESNGRGGSNLAVVQYEMYVAMGQPENGFASLDKWLANNPTDLEFRKTLGVYYLSLEQYARVESLSDEMIRINAQAGEGYFLKADVLLRQKRTAEAFEFYRQGFEKKDVTMDRKLEILWGLSEVPFKPSNPDRKVAEAGLEKLYALTYNESLRNETLHTYYGAFLLKQGKITEALKQYKIVCDLNGTDFTFWSNLLNLETQVLAYSDLYVDAQKAIELFPSQPVFYLHAGVGGYETGQYVQAEEFLFLGKDLIVNNPELLARFYTHLGKMECKRKQFDAGFAYFDQAKSAFAQGATVYGVQAAILFSQGKIAEAESLIQQGITINPTDAEVLHTQGLIFMHKKQYKQAVESLHGACNHNDRNGVYFEHYGDALYLDGQKEQAVMMWMEAQNRGNNSTLLQKKIANQTYYEN